MKDTALCEKLLGLKTVRNLSAEGPIESFDIGVLCWLAWLNVIECAPTRLTDPVNLATMSSKSSLASQVDSSFDHLHKTFNSMSVQGSLSLASSSSYIRSRAAATRRNAEAAKGD